MAFENMLYKNSNFVLAKIYLTVTPVTWLDISRHAKKFGEYFKSYL